MMLHDRARTLKFPQAVSGLPHGGALLLCIVLLTGCQLPAEPEGSLKINDPANVLSRTYEPKSKPERIVVEEIVEGAQAFQADSTTVQEVRGESAVANGFAGSGGVAPENWWAEAPFGPVLDADGAVATMGLEEAYQRALMHSSQVKVFAALPLIRETAIDQAAGVFDPEVFSQGRYDSSSEPTGTSLETGRPNDFFREDGWTYEGGVRKRTKTGGTVGLSQELSQKTNNSQFFIPGNQGRAALKLSVMQPLLRGAGVNYNRSLIQIAKLDAETGYDEFIRQLETHLMEVNRTYWALYLARAIYLDKQRFVSEAAAVVEELGKRGNLDAMASQMSRARSALATRKSDLVRSELAIRNAESRLRSLMNDPELIASGVAEIIPGDVPLAAPVAPEYATSVADALAYRPEIKQAQRSLTAANLREKMAKNEKLPSVNAVGEVGISALRGQGDVSGSYNDQFGDSEPTWGLGVVASMPLERRVGKAVHLRTELEVRQKEDQLRSAMDTVLLEVEISYREVITAWPDTKAKWDAAVAADQELVVLGKRRGVDANAGETSTSLYLEKLLDAQERSVLAREEFLRALVVYNSSLANLDRAKGTLLQHEDVGVDRTEDGNSLPIILVAKQEATKKALASWRGK